MNSRGLTKDIIGLNLGQDKGNTKTIGELMEKDKIRVIKIGKEALFEFIYEMFIDYQDEFLDVNPTEVLDFFDIDFENGQFIFCAAKAQNETGAFDTMRDKVNLRNVMKNMPDTTNTMFASNRYKEFTKEELIALSEA